LHLSQRGAMTKTQMTMATGDARLAEQARLKGAVRPGKREAKKGT
jgi:hypothetical protein